MSDDLPIGWVETNLDNLCNIETGNWDANHATSNGSYRFYTCAYEYSFCDTNRFSGECIILPGNGANVGEVFFYDGEFDCYQRTYVLSNIKIVAKYLFYNLLLNWEKANEGKQFGSATNYLRLGNFLNYVVPLSPLNEQRRIVDKLERIGDRHRTARNELNHIPKLIARYKQAVLAAACSGKLTEDWREKNPNIESASILLKQIQEKRNKEHEKASALAISKSRRKPKLIDNSEFEDFEFDPSENLDLPESWSLCNCKMLADLITDGEHATPVRTEDGIFLLSARNVQNGFLSFEKVDYIPDYEYERITKRCNPEANDILISCSGSVGRVCRVPENVKFTMVRSVALIKLQYNLELSEYLELALQSTISQSQILKLQKATAQANLFIGQIGKIVILLPPLEEQKEIVRRVEKMFEKIDIMEEEYQKAAKLCDRLEQATLAKAFRGELVPQDPHDEPASVLLKQVKRKKEKRGNRFDR